jgi:ribose 5-phosphate isomerase
MSGKSKAGPVVTDNSNFIIDWFFDFDEIRKRIQMPVRSFLQPDAFYFGF